MKLSQHTTEVIDKFAEMMIARMDAMRLSKWKKGWIGCNYGAGPVNLEGVSYRGANALMLTWGCVDKEYRYPIFCTLKQANKLGARVNKGAQSLPIIFWDFYYIDAAGKRLTSEEYNRLQGCEQLHCKRRPFLKCYSVFNVDQTTIPEKHPEKIEKLQSLFAGKESPDAAGMYENADIDKLLINQSWVCPIKYQQRSNHAYYNPAKDFVVVPKKSQFKTGATAEEIYMDGQEYYATLIHELVHSTAPKDRLNRQTGSKFGDKQYAIEELVAELGAARCGQILGFDKKMLDNNAVYLDSWITSIRENPLFIISLMSDVEKASKYILERISA